MKPIGIKAQLTLVLCIFSLILLIPFSFYLYQKEKNSTLDQLTESMILHGKILRSSLIDPNLSDPDIQKILKEQTEGLPYRITIIDTDGHVVADTWEDPTSITSNHNDREEIIAARQGLTNHAIRYSDTLHEDMLYTAIPLSEKDSSLGVIRIAGNLSLVENLLSVHQKILFSGIGLSILAALFIGYFLARQFTRPLEEITQTAEKIAQGNLHARSHIRRNDEIGILAHTINHLAASLDEEIQHLSSERQKFQLVLEHMENLVFLLDKEGIILETNKAAREKLGEVILHHHHKEVLKNHQIETVLHKALQETKTQSLMLSLNSSTYQAYLTPLHDDSQVAFLLILHDVTTLQELYLRQSEFVANASHELATPLSAIQGFSETLINESDLDQESKIHFLEIIHAESLRMGRLLKDLRQLARLEATSDPWSFKKESISLLPLLTDEMEKVASGFQDKKIQLISNISLDLPSINGSADWLGQAFTNLLTNAYYYTEENGTITVSAHQENDFIHISVQDTGIGIPAEDLPKIFQRFFRVDRSRNRKEGGTGLGLAIVKHIITLHQGKVWAESAVDKGSTFHILLLISSDN